VSGSRRSPDKNNWALKGNFPLSLLSVYLYKIFEGFLRMD
jgi:hypothetical protein